MKKPLILFCLFVVNLLSAQENLEDLLAAGIEDAQRFARGYISPAAEAGIFNMSNGWIQSAEVKKPLRFDVSIIGNATFIKEEDRSFLLNTNEYNNLQFRDGSTSKQVATAFGENDPEVLVFAEVQNGPFTEEVEFLLPQGLAAVNVRMLPTAFYKHVWGCSRQPK